MKNNGKNRSEADSHSASDAAALLGVSVPTLKRMVRDGTLEGFHTPGGHLRVLAESIEAVREQRQTRPRPVREASPVLQNRRERLEELTLEAQEHRARRELEKLRAEEQEEAESREAEAEAREEEAAQRQAELELEREQLEFEKAQEQARRDRELYQEEQMREAGRELAAFRCRWQERASEAVAAYEYRWLLATQRKEVLEGLEAEIEKRQPADEPRMAAIIARSLQALAEPIRADRDAQERRQKLTNGALWSLPGSATEVEKIKATAAIRDALRRFGNFADVCEMRVAAQEAVQPVRQAVGKRLLDERLIKWAVSEMPFWGRTEQDEARLWRECAEILAELPMDVSEAEAKEAVEPTIREACQDINRRQAEKERQARKASLIQQAVAEVSSYLLDLKHEGEITSEEYWDSEFRAGLERTLKGELQAKLTGDETTKEIRESVREIIDEELA